MGNPAHILMVPFPAQGHLQPLLKLAYKVASHGIRVTFVNTGSVHSKPIATKLDKVQEHNNVVFVSVSVGLQASDDGTHIETTMEKGTPAGNLINLVRNIEDLPITCVVADAGLGWILSEVAEKLPIRTVVFSPPAVGSLALSCHISELIEAGTIDSNGKMVKSDEVISPSADIPPWKAIELAWTYPGNDETERFLFEFCKSTQKQLTVFNGLCAIRVENSSPAACDLIPGCLPIGPLIESDDVERTSGAAGSFWLEDTSCLDWLDTKPQGSVIYVAFGSAANLSQQEFDELALGLEISGRPFLWVARSDFVGEAPPNYPEGFLERVADRGKIVEWAPQEKVLAHPSIACFLTHCRWNSTMESLSRGIPFLCWSSFADQFHDAS